jgi:hypothetical protein
VTARSNPLIRDGLTLDSWPKFLHPFPLDQQTFFLVSCKPRPDAPWGLYLADVFDNLVPCSGSPTSPCSNPCPCAPPRRPPVIPDR